MKFPIIIILFVLSALSSCELKPKQTLQEKQKELDAGKLDEKNIYTAKEIGWTVQLPADWQVLTKRENYELNETGKEAIEKSMETKINDSGLIDLISIKKNKLNIFESTIEHYNESTDGSYDDHTIMIHELVKKTIKRQGIYAEYELGAVRIDGIMFDRFGTIIYSSDKSKIILRQKMFSALINGYAFGIVITFNNESDEKTLMNVVNSSKFSIKK